jgi:hypothetical protein
MAKPFRGVIKIDVTQSTPDWEPVHAAGRA